MEKEYLILTSVLINFLIGLFLFSKEKSKGLRIHFLIFTLFITLWSLSLYFYINQFLLNEFWWTRIIIPFTFFIVFELLLLIFAISKKALKEFKFFLTIFFILSTISISIIFSKIKIFEVLPPPFLIFFLSIFLYGAWVVIIFFERFLKSSNLEHLQTISVLGAFGLFAISVGVVNAFLPIISGLTKYSWLNPVFSLFLVIFMAFVITRYHLLKTRIIWIEFLTGIMGVVLLILPFLMPNFKLRALTIFVFFLFSILGYYLSKTTWEEQKRRKEEEKLAEEWKRLQMAREEFILFFQHHLRTPLVPIKGYLDMILKEKYGSEENPVIREKLIEIKKRVDILYSLIESILTVQEFRMGKKNLNLEDCQINNLIESVIEELKIEAEEKGLYLKFEKVPLPPIKLEREKIRTAIWNLVDNAIKYTNEGGITIITKIEYKKLKIGILDTGIGMEKEGIDYFLKGRLFERGEEAKKLYGPGRGIGLALAIEFVKIHGGKILAESVGQGKGTTFWIELPIE